MTFSYDLSSLDTDAVAANREIIRSALAARFPDYDTRRGVIHDLVLELFSLLSTAQEAELDKVRSQSRLDAADVSETSLDAIAANYRISRRAAASASGQVRVLLSRSMAVTLPAGTLFSYGTRRYATTGVFHGRTDNALVTTDADRLISSEGAYYGFTVDVEAVTPGSTSNLARLASLSMSTPPTSFVGAYAWTELAGGADAESNTDLVARIQSGLSSRAWGNRASLEALIRATYPAVQAVSAVGAAAAEMLRDRHGLFPVGSGGKVDLYLRSQPLYDVVTKTMTASLVSKVGSVGTWQVNFDVDDVPGFYEVEKVLLSSMAATDAGFTPSADSRSYTLSGDYQPDIVTATEAAYSAYQTAQVQFADTVTNATALSLGVTASYQVVVRYMPLVGDVQTLLGSLENRPLAADVLVKAPIPVFTEVTLDFHWPTGSTAPAVEDIQTVLADAVGAQNFSNRLSSSLLASAARARWPQATLDNVVFTTRLRKPDGTSVNATVSDVATVTADAANMVGSNTLAFYLRAGDIDVTVDYV